MKLDYYRVMGLQGTTSAADIKKAYRRLAMQYHPDRNPGDESSEERFKLIKEAYEVLKDPRKRAKHDRMIAAFEARLTGKRQAAREEVFIPDDEILGDFLKGFYDKSENPGKKVRKGKDIRYNLKITFKEAARGAKKEIKLPCETVCPQCEGTGVRPGAGAAVCPGCRGKGKVKYSRSYFELCHTCNGSGAVITGHCTKCKGSGTVQSRRTILILVPPGVEAGTRLQMKGMGTPGSNGGKPGDIIVVVHVKRQPFFERDDLNIICNVPVPFIKAALGCSLEVPTLDGKKKVKVPPGSKTGRQIRFKAQGIRSQQSRKNGDLIICLKVEMPNKLSREEKRVLKTLQENSKPETYPRTAKYKKNMEKL